MKFYQRNDHIINSDVNVKFEDLLEMTPDQFKDWVVRLREELTYAWDTNGCPPRTGKNEEDMIAHSIECPSFLFMSLSLMMS